MFKIDQMKKIIAIILLLFIGVSAFFLFANFSDGVRSGIIMKISKKGVVFKTHEGQLNVGGFDQSADEGMSNVWDFSVTDEEVLEDLKKAMGSSERVNLYYKEKYIQLPWRGDTKYFVYKVEETVID